MKLGLREANQHFSRAIKAVRAGKEVVLTERGRPIAVIKPIPDDAADETALQAMIDQGLVRAAARSGPMPSPRWRPARAKGRPLSHTVREGREDRA